MLKKSIWLLAITGLCLLLYSESSHGQKPVKVEKTDEEIRAERMQKLMTAYELAEQGRKHNAPEYLITAASILRELSQYKDLQSIKPVDLNKPARGENVVEVKLESTNEDPKGAVLDKQETPAPLLDQSNELYKEASDMGAAANINVDKLIKQAKDRAAEEERKTAGIEKRAVVGGPKQITRRLAPGQKDTFTFQLITNSYSQWFFNSGGPLVVSVRRGDTSQPFYWGTTTYAARVWHPNWHPNPKIKIAPIVVQVQNYHKVPVQYQMMIQ